VKGDLGGTAYHLAGAVPLVGAPAQQVAQDLQRGDPAAAVGHGAALLLPFAHEPILAGLTRTAEAGGALAEGALKTAKSATGAAVDVVGSADPALREAVGVISPRAKHVLDVAARVKKARDAYAAAKAEGTQAAAATVETPGMALARESGADWANLSPTDQAMMETVAKAQANAAAQPAAQPAARPPMGPPQAAPREPIITPPPDIPPESGPPAAPAPEPAPPSPPAGGKPAAADLAAQLEASMRTEALTDYAIRNKIRAAMLDEFGPKEWQMVADQAGVKPPTPENIQAIRGNLAEHEGAAQITAKTPAEAVAEFETKRATRNRRNPKPAPEPPPDVGAQLADSLAAVEKGERPVAQVPDEGPPAATASDKRVEAYAQHFATSGTPIADIEPLTKLPEFPKLGRALEIQGSLGPGEAQRIAARVQELRGGSTAPAEVAPPAAAAPRARRSKPIR
jgi:hypothetical protein